MPRGINLKFILRQLKALWPTLVAIYIPTLCALGILVLLRQLTGHGMDYFTEDPAALMKSPFYLGFYSNIGVLIMCACAAICLFASAVLSKFADSKEWSRFLFVAGAISAILAVDDMFMLHEEVFPLYLHIDETIIFGAYGLTIVLFFARFWKAIQKTEFLLLLFALAFFFLMGFFDNLYLLIHHQLYAHSLLEDGAKLAAIVTWFAYFTRVSWKAMVKERDPSNP
jgi:hypothetical protein